MSPVVTLRASRIAVAGLLFGAMCLSAASDALAGKPVYVGGNVPAKRRISMDRYDHAAWDALLVKYVDGAGNVDYAAWKRSPDDTQALENYLGSLSFAGREIRASRAARLAYWINAYNAVTIKGILREYPTPASATTPRRRLATTSGKICNWWWTEPAFLSKTSNTKSSAR